MRPFLCANGHSLDEEARFREPGAVCTLVTCDMQRHRVSVCTRAAESSKTTWRERVSQSHAEDKHIIPVGIFESLLTYLSLFGVWLCPLARLCSAM